MTSTFMRPALALALALCLASCGGKASFPVKGNFSDGHGGGLPLYSGLVLTTNGMDLPVLANATTFSFPNSISYGDEYNVVVKTNPLHQTCGPINGADTAGRLATINVTVMCTVNSLTIGGSISGLTSDGLTLTNGSTGGTTVSLAAATTFTFGATVPYGATYGVTVLAQPAKENCSVTQNASGTMGDAAVNDIVVTCVPKPV